jgi:hypothetical protein
MTTETNQQTIKSPGRPINPNSKRQIELKNKSEKEPGQRGRPINPESKRQQYLSNRSENPNGKGRPVNPNSARQQKLNQIAEMKAKGTYKLGRPKQIKPEEVVNISEPVISEVVETPQD